MKIKVPTDEELLQMRNQFGRMLKPDEKGIKLFGADKKEVAILRRSRPNIIALVDRLKGAEDDLGYCNKKREDGSESSFRISAPNRSDLYLTYEECDEVLGSNYYLIDEGYSSPGPLIRKVLFEVEANRPDQFNAFEIGSLLCGKICRIPVLYYKIPQERFIELRDFSI